MPTDYQTPEHEREGRDGEGARVHVCLIGQTPQHIHTLLNVCTLCTVDVKIVGVFRKSLQRETIILVTSRETSLREGRK